MRVEHHTVGEPGHDPEEYDDVNYINVIAETPEEVFDLGRTAQELGDHGIAFGCGPNDGGGFFLRLPCGNHIPKDLREKKEDE